MSNNADIEIKDRRTAIVTGGFRGIGRAIAEKLSTECDNVIVTSRFCDDFRREKNIVYIRVNVTQENDRKKLLQVLSENNLVPNILVNNVGHTLDIIDPECSLADWENIINLNLYTAISMINLLLPLIRLSTWGRIVNISSNAGIENSGPVTFSVSKAALTAYTRSMGRVLASTDPQIVLTAILPGVVMTDEGHWSKVAADNPEHMQKYIRERCPLGRFGTLDEVAEVVNFYCSKAVSFAHGAIVPLDGGQAKGFFTHNYM
jgi:3-oxoacyl-[acyl-carrier protein] reductase